MVVAKDLQAGPRGYLGRHVVAELLECDPLLLEDVSFLQEEAALACELAGATILSAQSHKFQPQGATAMVLLAESHLSIHTWPEHAYAAVDVYTCGPALRPEEAVTYLANRLGAKRHTMLVLNRGVFSRRSDGTVAFLPHLLECEEFTRAGRNGCGAAAGSAHPAAKPAAPRA